MQTEVIYVCRTCQNRVRPPSQAGRSWCRNCESFNPPDMMETDPEGEESPAGSDHAYTYTTWRPASHRFEAGELPDHRFMYIKRVDRLVPHGRAVSYKAKCSCKTWNNPNGFTVRRAAKRQWEAHMAEVEKQGTLFLPIERRERNA